jgi:hypothetical protein
MGRYRAKLVRRLCPAGAVAAVVLLLAIPANAGGPLETAVLEPESAFLERVRAAGATAVQMHLNWRSVAPTQRPIGFDPSNPADPAYDWSRFDAALKRVTAKGFRPLVAVLYAPAWAEGKGIGAPGTVRPDPVEFGKFARAAALRYSGSFGGLPRIQYWQAWAEQNLFYLLNPQREKTRAVSPALYRRMLNSFATAVHSVRADNVVGTGGLAPFEVFAPDRKTSLSIGPLEFMRLMLCMSKDLKPTCRAKSRFDAWAHHPYTSGGPNHHASRPDDVSLGDLPEMKRLLNAAIRAGHVVSRQPVRFWVTEFGWDTNPPDPKGVPLQEHARWVSEALYRMWQSGVSLVVWLQIRDNLMSEGVVQQGLYLKGPTPDQDQPKPALQAFRFPTVALPSPSGVAVWGRTPTSSAGRVILERRLRGGWRRLAVVRANRYGIFQRAFKIRPGGYIRARASSGELSLPFAVRKTRDRRVCPFGTLPNCGG